MFWHMHCTSELNVCLSYIVNEQEAQKKRKATGSILNKSFQFLLVLGQH